MLVWRFYVAKPKDIFKLRHKSEQELNRDMFTLLLNRGMLPGYVVLPRKRPKRFRTLQTRKPSL